MLALMSTDPKYANTIRDIHARAERWYSEGRDRILTREQAGAEALYHRLMLWESDDPVPELHEVGGDTALYADMLGEAVAELRPVVEAQVRRLRGEPLDDELAIHLPEADWWEFVDRRGREFVTAGDAGAALGLFARRHPRGRSIPEATEEAREATSGPSWAGSPRPTATKADRPDYWEMTPTGPLDVMARSSRYAFLNALASQDAGHLSRYLSALEATTGSQNARAALTAEELSERVFCRLLATLGLGDETPERIAPAAHVIVGRSLRQQAGQLRSRLRHLVNWLFATLSNQSVRVPDYRLPLSAGLFSPNPEVINSVAHLARGEERGLRELAGWLLVTATDLADVDIPDRATGLPPTRSATSDGDQIRARGLLPTEQASAAHILRSPETSSRTSGKAKW